MVNRNYKLELHSLTWWVMHRNSETGHFVRWYPLGTYPQMSKLVAENKFREYMRTVK